MNNTSRAKTDIEVREEFLSKLRELAIYWANTEGTTSLEKCEGVVFSILNIFDGTSCGLPAMDISLSPHESDKEYAIEKSENWYESGMVINNTMMHEKFYV